MWNDKSHNQERYQEKPNMDRTRTQSLSTQYLQTQPRITTRLQDQKENLHGRIETMNQNVQPDVQPDVQSSESLPEERHARNICRLEWDNKTALNVVDTVIHFYNLGSPTFLHKSSMGTAQWLNPHPYLPYMMNLTNPTDPTDPTYSYSKDTNTLFTWKRWEVKNHASVNCVYLTLAFQPNCSKKASTIFHQTPQIPQEFGNYLIYNHQDDEISFVSSSIPEGYILIALFADYLRGMLSLSNVISLLSSFALLIRSEHYNILMLMDRKLHIKKQHLLKYAPLCYHMFNRVERMIEY